MRVVASVMLAGTLLSGRGNAQTLPDYSRLREYLKARVEQQRINESNAQEALNRANALVAAAANDPDASERAKAARAIRERTLLRFRLARESREKMLSTFQELIRNAAGDPKPIGFPVLERRGEISVVTPSGIRNFDGRLADGETIRSGSDGKISLLLPWGAVVQIGPNSSIELSRKVPNVGIEEWHSSIHILEQCAAAVIRDGYCSTFRVPHYKFPIAVRGSEVALEGVDSVTTRLEVFDGAVDFRDSTGSVTFTVKNGTSALIKLVDGRPHVTVDTVRIRDWWSQN